MRPELIFEAQPFQDYTEFDEFEAFDSESADWEMPPGRPQRGRRSGRAQTGRKSSGPKQGTEGRAAGRSRGAKSAQSTGAQNPCAILRSPCEVLDKFEFNKAVVLSRHKAQLINVARCLIASQSSPAPIRSIKLVGHTDPRGTEAYNRNLGQQRAEQAARALRGIMEQLKSGSSGSVQFALESRGESQPAGKDAALNRRVEVCLPGARVEPPKQQTKQQSQEPTLLDRVQALQSARTKTVRIVVKSYIAYIGDRIGVPPCGAEAIPRLYAQAKTTDLSYNENPGNDFKDGKYRLYTARTFQLKVGKDGEILSLSPSTIEKDGGLECIPGLQPLGFQKPCFKPPPLTVENEYIKKTGPTTIEFSWTALGRPSPDVESFFQAVCHRTSFYIWHKVSGTIDCSGPNVKVTLWLQGSKFPSHRAFINGVARNPIPQQDFKWLWVPQDLAHANLIAGGKPDKDELTLNEQQTTVDRLLYPSQPQFLTPSRKGG